MRCIKNKVVISIHAPIVGCDKISTTIEKRADRFQSTHPSWGATCTSSSVYFKDRYFNPRTHRGVRPAQHRQSLAAEGISIHAPIVGCDKIHECIITCRKNFNPRTHRGVRHRVQSCKTMFFLFQSTHPSWGATKSFQSQTQSRPFQSTHPSWGATLHPRINALLLIFQSTHPSWGATKGTCVDGCHITISIHAPIVGCDQKHLRN